MRDIEKLVSQMTMEEKVTMLCGSSNMNTPYNERLEILPLTMCDGPHGVRIEGEGAFDGADAVSFPCLSALGATWNEDILYEIGKALASECIRFDKAMLLGPGLNMKRTDLCGRNFEYFSEDPILTGVLGAAYINGLQDKGVGACAKHYAVNNQETDRLYTNSEIDERTMREIYLKAFEYVVKHSSPAAIMCAVNKVNSVLCSENKFLYDILKKEWKFEGFVMSDWGCCKNPAKSIASGLDLAMPKKPEFAGQLLQSYHEGEITEEEIDIAVKNVLNFMLGYEKQEADFTREQSHEICQKAMEEAIVLLKNEKELLPITPEKYKHIVVVGEFAEKPVVSGYGSSRVFPGEENIESALQYIRELAGDKIQVDYVPLYKTDEYPKKTQFRYLPSLNGVENADLVLMFVGREESVETEGSDRVTSHLNPAVEFFIKRIFPKNQNIVLVVQSGGSFQELNWKNKVKGIVQMWYGGEAGGSAIAKVLFGEVNPSGKLSETFPVRSRTDIDYPGDGYKVCYDEKWRIGYRYYDLHPEEIWYPFGYGLSYTKFEFSDHVLVKTQDGFQLSCKVTNVGEMAGKEVVQVYFTDCISTVSRPEKELLAFKKTKLLAPGESEIVQFDIKDSELAYYNLSLHKWITEPGSYDILVGASSRDIRLIEKYRYDGECEYTLKYNAEQIMG